MRPSQQAQSRQPAPPVRWCIPKRPLSCGPVLLWVDHRGGNAGRDVEVHQHDVTGGRVVPERVIFFRLLTSMGGNTANRIEFSELQGQVQDLTSQQQLRVLRAVWRWKAWAFCGSSIEHWVH